MIKLTRESLEKARDYIFTYGDDITIAWFKYNFENDNTDEFMSVLAQYQYENGGFGGLCTNLNTRALVSNVLNMRSAIYII